MQISLDDLYKRENEFLTSYVPPTYKEGKSIVTSCYGAEFPSAYVLLKELARLECKLPIEIFHKTGELTAEQIQILENAHPGFVTIKTIQGTPKDFISRYGHRHGWACKIYALLESEYAENLWIDSDNCPIKNPEFLFSDMEYLTKGSLFWRDIFSPDSADQFCSTSPLWPIFNIPYNDSELGESGQLLLNKNKCQAEFALLRFYADNCEVYYNFGGDKETFRLAWQRIGILRGWRPYQVNALSDPNLPYGFIPYGPFHKGAVNHYKKWGGGSVMVQRDREGRELFNHRNLAKFKLNDNPIMEDITNEGWYHLHIKELQQIYKA